MFRTNESLLGKFTKLNLAYIFEYAYTFSECAEEMKFQRRALFPSVNKTYIERIER